MLKTKYFLCAESAAADIRKNSVSVFHILENVIAPIFPFVIPRICIVASLERTTDEPSIMSLTLLVKLGEAQLFKGPLALNFAHLLQSRTFFEIGGLPVSASGNLNFHLLRDSEELATWTISIERLDAASAVQIPFPMQRN
jgi:hypothetical protein